MSELSPKEFEDLADRIDAQGWMALGGHGRSLILYALRSIASQSRQADAYGLALRMIRAGAADPAKTANDALRGKA